MRNKIKSTLPLFLAGLLFLSACDKEGTLDNYLSLEIEQPGTGGSKVALSGNSTYWMDLDLVRVTYGATSDQKADYYVRYNTSTGEPYLAYKSGDFTEQASVPVPEEGYYYLAYTPVNLFANSTVVPQLETSQSYKWVHPRIAKKQLWKMSIENNTLKYNSPHIPLVAMTHRNEKYLYMRPVGVVIDVQLTNNFSNSGVRIDSIVITSNMNINDIRRVGLYPGKEAQKPVFANNYPVSPNAQYRRVTLTTEDAKHMQNYFTPGTTLSFPVCIAPTDCIYHTSGDTPTSTELTFEVYGYAGTTPIHYTRTASPNRHIPGGTCFSAPIEIDENTAITEIDLKPFSGLNSGESFIDDGSI